MNQNLNWKWPVPCKEEKGWGLFIPKDYEAWWRRHHVVGGFPPWKSDRRTSENSNRTMRKVDYLEILKRHYKTSARKSATNLTAFGSSRRRITLSIRSKLQHMFELELFSLIVFRLRVFKLKNCGFFVDEISPHPVFDYVFSSVPLSFILKHWIPNTPYILTTLDVTQWCCGTYKVHKMFNRLRFLPEKYNSSRMWLRIAVETLTFDASFKNTRK